MSNHCEDNAGSGETITPVELLLTVLLLVFFSVTGVVLASLFTEAFLKSPVLMSVIPALFAIFFVLVSFPNHSYPKKGLAGAFFHVFNWFSANLIKLTQLHYSSHISDNWSEHLTRQVLITGFLGALISGIGVAAEILKEEIIFLDLLFTTNYLTPERIMTGAICGMAIFIFRKILFARWGEIFLTLLQWKLSDIPVRLSVSPGVVEGVYWQCPACHNRLSFKTNPCPCGKSLNLFSFFTVKRFWIHYRYPDGSDELELVYPTKAVINHLKLRVKQQ